MTRCQRTSRCYRMPSTSDHAQLRIEEISALETEAIHAHVEQLLLDKAKCDAELVALQNQHDEDSKQVEICNLKIQSMQYEIDTLRLERAKETAAYHVTTEMNRQLVNENESLLTNIQTLQEKFDEQAKELAEARKELDELRLEALELRLVAKEFMEMKPKYLHLVEEEKRLRKALVICQAENSDLRRRLETTQQELAAALEENATLKIRVGELEILAKELAILKPKHAALVEHCDKLEKDNAELKRQNEDLRTRLDRTERELSETKTKYAHFSAMAKEELDRLGKENATYDGIVTAVRSEDARLRPCIFCSPAPRYVPERAARADEARDAARELRRRRGELLDQVQGTEAEYQINLKEHHAAILQMSFVPQ